MAQPGTVVFHVAGTLLGEHSWEDLGGLLGFSCFYHPLSLHHCFVYEVTQVSQGPS